MKLQTIVVIALLFLVGCTSSGAPTAAVVSNVEGVGNEVSTAPIKDITIEAFNWGFSQNEIKVKQGDRVRLLVKSREGVHGLGIPQLMMGTKEILPGEEQTLEFIATQSGSFDFRCNIPCGSGHREMKGKIIVEP